MKENRNKVLSFPSPVPLKAEYQRVKSVYTVAEIKQLFGLSERTIRRWTEQGIIPRSATSTEENPTYGFQALTQFRRVREMRSQGQTIRQIEAELQGQLSLFRVEEGRVARLLTPFEEALVLHEHGDPKASEYYREAINEGDNVAEAYCNLAIINLEHGNSSKALDQLTLSLKHEPRHVEAHYNLANLYYDHGNYLLARLHYEAATQIEPGFSLVYFNLALVQMLNNDPSAALRTLKKYQNLVPPAEGRIAQDLFQNLKESLAAAKSPRPNAKQTL